MRRIAAAQAGFTLFEVIIVLSVLGALTALLGPVVVGYVEDGNIARTETEAKRLATAINKMRADTGRYPFYNDGDGALSYASGTDAALLTSNAVCTGGSCTDATLPDDDST